MNITLLGGSLAMGIELSAYEKCDNVYSVPTPPIRILIIKQLP